MPVMDIYQNQDREEQNIVTRGSFNGDWGGNFVAVKYSKRPPGPKGETTIWASTLTAAPIRRSDRHRRRHSRTRIARTATVRTARWITSWCSSIRCCATSGRNDQIVGRNGAT